MKDERLLYRVIRKLSLETGQLQWSAKLPILSLKQLRVIGAVTATIIAIPVWAHAHMTMQYLVFIFGGTGLYHLFFLGALLQSKQMEGKRIIGGALYLFAVGLIWNFILFGPRFLSGIHYVVVFGLPPIIAGGLYFALRKKPLSTE